MLSACSTLILGLNSKHAGLSDRIRGAASEFRSPETSDARRAQLVGQIAIFRSRFTYTWVILTTLSIVVQQYGVHLPSALPLALFILGVALMLGAACLELAEVSLAARTLQAELDDILDPPRAKQPAQVPPKP